MKTIKLKLHSYVELITNSSTSIYSQHKDHVEPFKELINNFLKINNIDKTCDDIFVVNYFLIDPCMYFIDDDIDGDEARELALKYIELIQSDNEDKPQWMFDIERKFDDYMGTEIYISAKSEEYDSLAKQFEKFIKMPNTAEFCS